MDTATETNPRKNASKYLTLKADALALVRKERGTLKANRDAWITMTASFSMLFLSYLNIILVRPEGTWMIASLILLAFGLMWMMVGQMHDIMHGSFSDNPFFKNWLCYMSDLFGASSFIWKNKHNHSHHFYTNNAFVDNDLNVSKILRFTEHHPWFGINRLQHLYILPAYAIHTPFWFFVSDFRNILQGRITRHKLIGFDRKEKVIFFAGKCVHLFLALGLPSYLFGFKNALLGYLFVYAIIGLLLALIFQVAHVFEGTRVHSDEKFETIDDWAKAQIEGTANFAPDSRIAYWFYGGLNYQIFHHLFPEVGCKHLYVLRPLVRQYCAENGIKYNEFPTLGSAIASHLRQIRKLASP